MATAALIHRFHQQTLVMSLSEMIAHVDGCAALRVAGACGGLFVCNACDRTFGNCHSKSDMPAVCLVCRARYLRAWG